jgi:hypothetical protein
MGLTLGVTAYAMEENPDIQSPEEISRAHAAIDRDFAHARSLNEMSIGEKVSTLTRYAYLDPNHEVPPDLLNTAVLYLNANETSFPNQAYIAIVDFKPRSDAYRLYIVNMQTGAVEHFHTTHGVNSDPKSTGYASIFGNVINSGKSSLGFVRTAEVYTGAYKRSLRLDGVSKTDSNIRDRAVVFHGWDGVHEKNVIQGMSHGCITLDWTVKDAAIDEIKEGALMYLGYAGQPAP